LTQINAEVVEAERPGPRRPRPTAKADSSRLRRARTSHWERPPHAERKARGVLNTQAQAPAARKLMAADRPPVAAHSSTGMDRSTRRRGQDRQRRLPATTSRPSNNRHD